jgi:hypothetical protein
MFEIGNSLREARMRQGLDYNQVELATKIRAKYIRALEEEQFEVLPSGTYIKGFLRSYADFLGLDGQLYVDEYSSRFVVDAYDDMPQRRARTRPSHHERSLQRRVVLLTLAGIAAVAALVFVAFRFDGQDKVSLEPAASTQQKPAAPQGLRFVGRGKGTYLAIRRTSGVGPVVFQGTLRRGAVEFILGRRFWILVRRPTGVRFRLLGKPLSLPAHRNLKVVVTPSKTTRVAG